MMRWSPQFGYTGKALSIDSEVVEHLWKEPGPRCHQPQHSHEHLGTSKLSTCEF